MLRRIGNRAYRKINRLLNLDGNESPGLVDLGQVFLVQDVAPALAESLGVSVMWHHTDNVNGAVSVSLDPMDPTDWTEIVESELNPIPDDTVEAWADTDEYVTLLDGFFLDADVAGNLTEGVWYMQPRGVAGTPNIPLGPAWDTGVGVGNVGFGPAAGSVPFFFPLPLRFDRGLFTLSLILRTSAAVDVRWGMWGRVYPSGALDPRG